MLIFIGYKIVRFIALITPYPITYLIAVFLAKLGFALRLNTDKLKNNISKVTDLDINDKKVHQLAATVMIKWLKNVTDFLKQSQISKEKLKERVRLEGLGNLKDALKKGKGAVLITAHIGNFEWAGNRLAAEGINIWGTSLTRKNKRVQKFFEDTRLSQGMKTLYVDRLLNVFRILKKNSVVAIPSDWDSSGMIGKPFKFFGKTAYFPTGAVSLALRSGAPILMCFIWRVDKYNHKEVVTEPIELVKKGNKDILVQKNMEKVVKVMEKYIRDHIDEWELFHDIWEKE